MTMSYPQSTPRQRSINQEKKSPNRTGAQRKPEKATLPVESHVAPAEEGLPAAETTEGTWDASEYVPVGFARNSWPGLQNFRTWVIFGDTYSVNRTGVWHRELKKVLHTRAKVQVYAKKSGSVRHDLPDQVDKFVSEHRSPSRRLNPRETLYVFAAGLYDCMTCDSEAAINAAVDALFNGVRRLYGHNARNFLLLDALPGERMSLPDDLPKRVESPTIGKNIRLWNRGLVEGTSKFGYRNGDTSVFLFSANRVATDLLDGFIDDDYREGEVRTVHEELWRALGPNETGAIIKQLHTGLAEVICIALYYAEMDTGR
ncbi:hypothetical protein FOMPIDRAFT_1049912 [Fomitopsis schrenkii]|uniref:Uncharacterized protein n=1 Tax=Fomitopsis schrenkii TaxID=2126942 RepID=S8E9T7_FOMSC|nr:hypothetical protein FOMPIDRAFT_1049912 [Fomitopsis schrenkii]